MVTVVPLSGRVWKKKYLPTDVSGGQICIPKWVLEKLNLKDGDILDLTVTDDGKSIYRKRDSHP